MTSVLSSFGASQATPLSLDVVPTDTEPALRDVCGLLTVQARSAVNEYNSPQLEETLRTINGTEIGAALLRAIATADIPPRERPLIMFDGPALPDGSLPGEDIALDSAQLIHFPYEYNMAPDDAASVSTVYMDARDADSSPSTGSRGTGLFGIDWIDGDSSEADRSDTASSTSLFESPYYRRQTAVMLFADLAVFLASRTGQSCLAPSLGSEPYRALAFREQLGETVPAWQYSLEAFIRDAGDTDENRAMVWEQVTIWCHANNPEAPLRLNSLKLRACPPLHDLPGLKWLMLADNALTAFPSSDLLPPTLVQLDLAANPIARLADSYSPALRQVILDKRLWESGALQGRLPPHIQIVEAEPDHVETLAIANDFITEFPLVLVQMAPVEEMEERGWSNEIMGRLYPKDMLEKAVAKWLEPAAPAQAAPGETTPRDTTAGRNGDTPGPDPAAPGLLDAGRAPHAAGDVWRRLQEADANGALALATLMNRLHDAWTKEPDPVFRERFTGLLAKMGAPGNEEFRWECVSIARDGTATCDDQILYTLNNLHIASLNADVMAGHYDERLVELMHHAEDMLNMHTLTRFFADLHTQLQERALDAGMKFDEVEQWLHLHTLLQQTTHLPAMQFSMRFANMSLVTEADAVAANARIEQARNEEYLAFLGSWTPLQSVIRRVTPALAERADRWKAHIHNDRGRLYGALDRILKTDGRLFAAPRASGMALFSVGPRIFWTRFERLVHERLCETAPRLAELARQRKPAGPLPRPAGPMDEDLESLHTLMQDALPQACRAVNDEVQRLIQVATVREFLDLHYLKLEQAIRETEQPRWFKQLRKALR